MEQKIAIVTGGSNGIGLCVVNQLMTHGYIVYEFSRHENVECKGKHISIDVTNEEMIRASIAEIVANEKRLDLVVNCAGFGISGAAEFTSANEARKQLDVNVIGTANMCKESIPYLRETKGKIINVSSVAAPAAIPFQSWYSVSKAGINAYTEALANEVRPFGIRVCAVMPGDTKTGFTKAREKNVLGDEIYNGRISRSVHRMERDEQNGDDPNVVAEYIVKIAKKKKVKPLYTSTFVYRLLVLLIKLLPQRFVNWLLYQLYAK